jgi:hypothetical protein
VIERQPRGTLSNMPEDWGEEPLEEHFVFDHVTWDGFGVPSNIMGRHDEEFFSMLGRIVALAATLEYKILVFFQYLVGGRQDVFAELTVAKLIAGAQEELHRLKAPEDRQLAEQFLLEAKAVTTKRNAYVHSLWPAQSGGRTFGWRVPPNKNATEPIITEGTLDEMRDDLGRLVALLEVNYLNRVLGLVSGGQHLRTQDH